jgi:hypothetical protein
MNLHQDTAMFVLTTVGAREAAGQGTADDAAVCVRADPARAARRPVRIVIRPASLKVGLCKWLHRTQPRPLSRAAATVCSRAEKAVRVGSGRALMQPSFNFSWFKTRLRR